MPGVATVASVAEMTLVPAATPVASPFVAASSEIAATVVVAEIQVAMAVTSTFGEPSLIVPIATNCSVCVFAIVGFAGVTVTAVTTAAVTVSVK